MSKNQEFENMGIGLELKIIYNISPLEALKKFYNDLDGYDDVVEYKKVIEE